MRILNQGRIFDAEKARDSLRVCTGTSLCRLASGKILAAFRLGSAKDSADGNGIVAESGDEGKTWRIISEGFQTAIAGVPGSIRLIELVEPRPGVLLTMLSWFERSDPDKSLFDAADGLLPARLVLAQSQDNGHTWTNYRTLDTGPYQGCSVTGPIVQLHSGNYLLAFETYGPRETGGPAVAGACALITADGQSLDALVTTAEDPEHKRYYWDQRLAYSPVHQRPVAMFWTYDRGTEKDMPVHIAWGEPDGRHWETPRATSIQGQITAPIPLPDGRLLAFYVRRHPPGSMRLIMSEDDGRTWGHDTELVLYESQRPRESGTDGESDFAQYWEDMGKWTFGHPAGILLDEHTVLLAYYAGNSADCLSACWARVEL